MVQACAALYLLAALQYPLVNLMHEAAHFLATHSPSHAGYLTDDSPQRHGHPPGTPTHRHSRLLDRALQQTRQQAPDRTESVAAVTGIQELLAHHCNAGSILPEALPRHHPAPLFADSEYPGICIEPLIPPPRGFSGHHTPVMAIIL